MESCLVSILLTRWWLWRIDLECAGKAWRRKLKTSPATWLVTPQTQPRPSVQGPSISAKSAPGKFGIPSTPPFSKKQTRRTAPSPQDTQMGSKKSEGRSSINESKFKSRRAGLSPKDFDFASAKPRKSSSGKFHDSIKSLPFKTS